MACHHDGIGGGSPERARVSCGHRRHGCAGRTARTVASLRGLFLHGSAEQGGSASIVSGCSHRPGPAGTFTRTGPAPPSGRQTTGLCRCGSSSQSRLSRRHAEMHRGRSWTDRGASRRGAGRRLGRRRCAAAVSSLTSRRPPAHRCRQVASSSRRARSGNACDGHRGEQAMGVRNRRGASGAGSRGASHSPYRRWARVRRGAYGVRPSRSIASRLGGFRGLPSLSRHASAPRCQPPSRAGCRGSLGKAAAERRMRARAGRCGRLPRTSSVSDQPRTPMSRTRTPYSAAARPCRSGRGRW